LQEDLSNEKADYQQDPDLKKQALIEIINDYNGLVFYYVVGLCLCIFGLLSVFECLDNNCQTEQ
jgi:hypothetical protein